MEMMLAKVVAYPDLTKSFHQVTIESLQKSFRLLAQLALDLPLIDIDALNPH